MRLKPLLLAASLSLASADSSANIIRGPIEVREGAGAVYRRARFQGEMDLTLLAKTVCKEDLWIYASGKWYDVGVNETESTVNRNEEAFERALFQTRGPVYEYHTHPHDWCPEHDYPGISLEPMSYIDIEEHVLQSERVSWRGRRFFSRVADEHGIWNYSVGSLRRKILDGNAWNLIEKIQRSLDEREWDIKNMPIRRFDSRLRGYIAAQRRNGLDISYRLLR